LNIERWCRGVGWMMKIEIGEKSIIIKKWK
jgi:hypothetical protein